MTWKEVAFELYRFIKLHCTPSGMIPPHAMQAFKQCEKVIASGAKEK